MLLIKLFKTDNNIKKTVTIFPVFSIKRDSQLVKINKTASEVYR